MLWKEPVWNSRIRHWQPGCVVRRDKEELSGYWFLSQHSLTDTWFRKHLNEKAVREGLYAFNRARRSVLRSYSMVTPVEATDHRAVILADAVIEHGCVFGVDLTLQHPNPGRRFQWTIPRADFRPCSGKHGCTARSGVRLSKEPSLVLLSPRQMIDLVAHKIHTQVTVSQYGMKLVLFYWTSLIFHLNRTNPKGKNSQIPFFLFLL